MALTSPSLLHTCFVTSKHFFNHDVNMERATSVISAEVNGLVLALFFFFCHWFRSKFDFRKIWTLLITCFLNDLTFFNQNLHSFQKVELSMDKWRVKETFQTILVIIFWHFLIILLRSESRQVKRYLISSITNLVYESPHDFRSVLRLLGN